LKYQNEETGRRNIVWTKMLKSVGNLAR
jgi:hypothetical protein